MAWVPAFESMDHETSSSSPACAVPSGTAHALDPETARVACGRAADGLTVDPDLTWPLVGLAAADVCPACEDAA